MGPPAIRLRTIILGADAMPETQDGWLPVYGGEAVLVGGRVAGRLRSAAFGYTMRRMLGYVYLPRHLAEGSEVSVDVLGQVVRGTVGPDALIDPGGERMRA
jgi:glycine cleavage system aminomethyltransferase T